MSSARSFTRLTTLALLLSVSALEASSQTSTVLVPTSARCADALIPVGFRGRAVALNNDRLLLGAWAGGSSGTALMYDRDLLGNWLFTQRLSDPIASRDGGTTVALDGDFAIVGAPYDAIDNDFGEGGASIHRFDGASWQVDAILQTGSPDYLFGTSVDISGDTAVIGAPSDGTTGHIYFLRHDGAQWQWVFDFRGFTSTPGPGNHGASVAISGDVAVGATPGHPTEQVVVYRQSGTSWSPSQAIDLYAITPLASAGFTNVAFQVALDGDTLLVDVHQPFNVPDFRWGVAVFEDQGSGFVYQQLLEASDGAAGLEKYGAAFAVHDDQIVIGAPKALPWGAAYHYRRDMTGVFVEESKFVPMGGEFVDGLGTLQSPEFGSAVAVASDRVVVSARLDLGIGTAYVLANTQMPSTIQSFCFGNGGLQVGCTDCPCGNNASVGTVGGCLNSSSTSAALAISGEASVSNDSAHLELTRAQPGALALLVSGVNMLPLSPTALCPPGSGVRSVAFDGLRCVAGPTLRHGTRMTDATGAVGGASAGWGGQSAPVGGLVAQGGFVAGQERFFQAIYRDHAALNCNTGLNTSNAVRITVTP